MYYKEMNQANYEKFMELLSQVDPELYRIKVTLDEYKEVPVHTIPLFIRSLGNLLIGTGYGRVSVYVQAKVVSQIKG